MIHTMQGAVRHAQEGYITLECGAISFLIQVPQSALFAVGETINLQTYMHWNQEQGPSLFGFSTDLERSVFQLIISCSGLGPKIALAILADLGAKAFLETIHTSNEKALTQVSGIGAKKAEQMIVQLKHKVAKLIDSGIQLHGAQQTLEQWQTVSQVLQSLNYSRSEISAAIKYINEQPCATQLPFDQLMRHALSFLAKKT